MRRPQRAVVDLHGQRRLACIEGPALEHQLRGQRRGADRATKVVADDAKKQVSRVVRRQGEMIDRPDRCLIYGFVEPNHVEEVAAGGGVVLLGPQLQYGGAQGTIFRDHPVEVEAIMQALGGVDLRGTLWNAVGCRSVASGLGRLLRAALERAEFLDDETQYLHDMVLQRARADRGSPGYPRADEARPLARDLLDIIAYEGCRPDMLVGGGRGRARVCLRRSGLTATSFTSGVQVPAARMPSTAS